MWSLICTTVERKTDELQNFMFALRRFWSTWFAKHTKFLIIQSPYEAFERHGCQQSYLAGSWWHSGGIGYIQLYSVQITYEINQKNHTHRQAQKCKPTTAPHSQEKQDSNRFRIALYKLIFSLASYSLEPSKIFPTVPDQCHRIILSSSFSVAMSTSRTRLSMASWFASIDFVRSQRFPNRCLGSDTKLSSAMPSFICRNCPRKLSAWEETSYLSAFGSWRLCALISGWYRRISS
mmetsp:Transcript_30911/g.118479  ORF Transcript_30911/g.118479 Transcript_30911/m.118479 type:complete len:235 (-) Transcript_30911:1594-2298(-)